LRRTLASYPLLTQRVIAAIHWQALKLWLKGVPVFTHPRKLRHDNPEPAASSPAPVLPSKGNLLG
jgi:DUF1365 family protein